MLRLVSRRQFLRQAATVAAAGWASSAYARTGFLDVRLSGPTGSPLDSARLKTLIVRDLANDPLPVELKPKDGHCRVPLTGEPIQLACRLDVPGFGEVYCYADNEGRGYTNPAALDFVTECARTRRRRVRQALEANPAAADDKVDSLLAAASQPIRDIAGAYRSLAHGLHAGERFVLNAAHQRITRLPAPRHDFLFGAMVSRNHGPEFENRFTALFNLGTVNWYVWKAEQPENDQIDYSRMEQSTRWCEQKGIQTKGFGYVYLTRGAVPEWLRSWPYDKVVAEYERVVARTTRRFASSWRCVEVINEAHDKSNLFHYSHSQLVNLTVSACRAARAGAPRMHRLVNNCCLWAEYARRPAANGARQWSAFRYLKDCLGAGAQFERIGLQLYYPQQDLFEIDRMLERFKAFGCQLHISEIACNSAPGLDPASLRPKDLVPGWHGPWSESMQADWTEAIYTLCYSKPDFEAVGWWDLADYPGHFWPHGGLLRADNSPKETYHRLLHLKKAWGL